MAWDGANDRLTRLSQNLEKGASAVLGFNEPNLVVEANMSAQAAADAWPAFETAAQDDSVPIVVSPAMTYGNTHPIAWLDEFFNLCSGCRVDAIAVHSYTCFWQFLNEASFLK